jgi:hypothetical protein
MSGNARFTRGAIEVRVVHREPDPSGLVKVTCAGDPETSGYRLAYRGNLEQAIACLEACSKKLWDLKHAGAEPDIKPDVAHQGEIPRP